MNYKKHLNRAKRLNFDLLALQIADRVETLLSVAPRIPQDDKYFEELCEFVYRTFLIRGIHDYIITVDDVVLATYNLLLDVNFDIKKIKRKDVIKLIEDDYEGVEE